MLGGKKKKKKNFPSPAVCSLFMHVTYSTDTNIKTEVKYWYDIDVTVYWLFFQVLHLRINRRDSESQVYVYDCTPSSLIN